MPSALLTGLLLSFFVSIVQAAAYPNPVEGDYVIGNFAFASGEHIAQLTVHYRTIGTPIRDETGLITNAVLLLANLPGGGELLHESFGGVLFGPDQPLDARRYFLILPDNIDSGGRNEPRYDARDAVTAEYRLLLDHLGVNHLRLIVGNRAGGVQAWWWGRTYPYFVDALVPIDSLVLRPRPHGERDDPSPPDSLRADDASGPALTAVRAEVVAIMSAEGLEPELLVTLQQELARVRNARYMVVQGADSEHGAAFFAHKWKSILPELLDASSPH